MSRSLDLHTHLAPVVGDEVGVHRQDGALVLDGHRVGPDNLYDPAALEDYLDTVQIDLAAVSPPPPFFRQRLDREAGRRWVRTLNDGMLAAVAGRPRLLPMAYLPLEHPDVALEEYERVRQDPAWVAVAAAAGGASARLDGPELEPLWAVLDGDRRAVLLHPGDSPDGRLGRYYLANLLGNPVETGVACAELVFGGVLERHPGVRIVLSHCGGVVPAVVGRWQRGYDTDRPGLATDGMAPRELVRRLYADNLAHDPAVVDLTLATLGADRLVLGSDWPFPMGTDDPRALIAHLDRETVRRIAEDNAVTALDLDRVARP